MPGCSIGRNIQKYKGAGASTLQDALENGNVATTSIQTSGHFIGDGSLLTGVNISGGSIGNLQGVTDNGATSTTKITLTNTNESLETSGNINVGNNKFYLGDGGLLSNITSTSAFQQVTNQGNVSTNTISFTNPAESITTTGNVIVGTNVHATDFVGAGAGLTDLNADNINDGGLAIARGGTGVTTGITVLDPANLSAAVSISKGGTGQTSASAAATALGLGTGDSPQFTGISLGSTAITESSGTVSIGGSVIRTGDISLGTDTTGNYVKTVTAGNGLDISGSAGEGSDHTLSLDLKANHGLVIDNTELKIDLKSGGGLEFDSIDSYKMRVKLDDANTSGKLPVNKGGTANDTFTDGGVLYYDSSNTKFVSTGSGSDGDVLKIISGVPDWGSDNVGGSSSVGTLSQVTTNGASTGDKITLSNTDVSLETSGNVVVGNNKFFKGDAGLLSNVASSSVTINTSTASAENDLIFTTGSNSLDKDDNGRIKYNPGTNILYMFDTSGNSKALSASGGWTGSAASATTATTAGALTSSVKIGNVDFDGSSDITPEEIQMSDSSANTDFLIPFSSVTDNTSINIKLHSDMGVLLYNPSTGTLKSTKFDGDGSSLTGVTASSITTEASRTISISKISVLPATWKR